MIWDQLIISIYFHIAFIVFNYFTGKINSLEGNGGVCFVEKWLVYVEATCKVCLFVAKRKSIDIFKIYLFSIIFFIFLIRIFVLILLKLFVTLMVFRLILVEFINVDVIHNNLTIFYCYFILKLLQMWLSLEIALSLVYQWVADVVLLFIAFNFLSKSHLVF